MFCTYFLSTFSVVPPWSLPVSSLISETIQREIRDIHSVRQRAVFRPCFSLPRHKFKPKGH